MNPLHKWHECVKNGDTNILEEIMAENIVFHSPVIWSPQEGKYLTKLYLTGAMHVLGKGGFHYTKEIIGERQACLEFETTIDDLTINGVDIMTWNEEGKITEFKVMVRPIKALNAVWKGMAAMLEKNKK